MSLTRSQYDAVMRLYDKKQIEDHRIMQERKQKAYAAVPELAKIDGAVADDAVARLRRSLLGEDLPAQRSLPGEKLPAESMTGRPGAAAGVTSPEERKRSLLVSHGFPADYLDPVFQCPDCRDTGFAGNKKCHCFRQAVISLFYTQSGLKDILEKENFASFSSDWYPDDLTDPATGLTSRETMENVLKTCRKFASEFDSLGKPFLLLSGEPGRGKTFLTHCIAKELMDSAHSVIYYSAKDLFDRLADVRFRSARSGGYSSASSGDDFRQPGDARGFAFDPDYLVSSDLMIIDDLGTEYMNDFTKSEFFSILNGRISAGKGIVISTNYSLQDLSDVYSPRIISRIMESFTLLNLFGRDIRVLKAMTPGS